MVKVLAIWEAILFSLQVGFNGGDIVCDCQGDVQVIRFLLMIAWIKIAF